MDKNLVQVPLLAMELCGVDKALWWSSAHWSRQRGSIGRISSMKEVMASKVFDKGGFDPAREKF
jgi:hypothetical protein